MISMDSRTPSRRSLDTPTALRTDSSRRSSHRMLPFASGVTEAADKHASMRWISPPDLVSPRSAIVWTSTARYRPCGHPSSLVSTTVRPASTSMYRGG